MFASTDEAAGYLAALIDGEGSVYARKHRRLIQVYNSEKPIIQACLKACELLGIEARALVRENPAPMSTVPMWTVSIYGRANLERAASVLPLRSDRKREALRLALASYTRRPPVQREELEAMLAKGLTHRQMAVQLGYKTHGTVQYHLRRFGLDAPRRNDRCRCRGCVLGRIGFERLLAEGKTCSEIASMLGYKSPSAVHYHLNRLGLRIARRRLSRGGGHDSSGLGLVPFGQP